MPLVKHDYPVLEYDTASKAVFQPGNGKKCFPAKAVFAFLGDEVENYAHTHDGIQIDEFESATRRYPIYECLYNQEKICLCPAPVGSAAAVQVLEYLIAGGVTKIISVGSCGVLEDIPENRFLIPVSALRDEGTSYHYLPPSREVEISKAGINAIESHSMFSSSSTLTIETAQLSFVIARSNPTYRFLPVQSIFATLHF